MTWHGYYAISTAINSLLLIPGYYSEDPNVFLDAFDFWDQNSGIAFGDTPAVDLNDE